jgi:hypothetical protein
MDLVNDTGELIATGGAAYMVGSASSLRRPLSDHLERWPQTPSERLRPFETPAHRKRDGGLLRVRA